MAILSPSQLLLSPSSPVPEPLSQISDVTRTSKKRRQYRPARVLPYELRQHCITFVEEELYSQAFSLLSSLLISGADHTGLQDNDLLPAYIPPSQIISLAATLIVHPSMTNRARSADHVQAANDALGYLIHLNMLVGSVNADLPAAFAFSADSASRQGRRRGRAAQDSPASDDEHGRIRVDLANQASIWNVADDFWRVVGWAFNCSVQYPARWERWKLWLRFMLDVLEDDLEACITKAKVEENSGGQAARDIIMSGSLLARYLVVTGDGRTGKRRVMRAILPDGSNKSIAEFGEIWKNETKEIKPSKDQEDSRRKRLNVNEGEFGDYMDLDDEGDDGEQHPLTNSVPSVRRSGRKASKIEESVSDEESVSASGPRSSDFGGAESILLRQRFLALLAKICAVHEHAFSDVEDLSDLLTEFIRPLPLPIFTQFVLPSSPYLEPHAQASLYQTLLRPLISSDAPNFKAKTMTQADFESHFLPFSANYVTCLENARVSLLVEGLLRLLVQYLDLEVTESLKTNLERGIRARQDRAAFGARKKTSERSVEEDLAAGVLEASAMRMRLLVKLAEG